MKKYLCSMGAWVTLMALTAGGQTSSSGNSQGASSGATSSSQGNVPASQTQIETQQRFQNQQQQSQSFSGQTNVGSNFQVTNQIGRPSAGTAAGIGTNGPGLADRNVGVTNGQGLVDRNVGVTNGVADRNVAATNGLFPTGRAGETNRTFGTNSGPRGGSSYGTNENSYGRQRGSYGTNSDTRGGRSFGTSERGGQGKFQDEAVTETDRTLLVSVRERVQTEVRGLTSTAAGAWAPAVHFRIASGVVTIIGVVQSIEIKQQIEECVRRVPGVLRVENTIEVGSARGASGDANQVIVNPPSQGQVEPGRFQSGERLAGQVQIGPREPVQVQTGRAVETTRTFETSDRGVQGKFEDEALTETDQALLVSVRQKVLAEVRDLRNIAREGAWAPALHYRVVNGVVTVIGVIPTIELKRVVEECVRQVPGVVRVEDTIEVGGTQGSVGDADQVLVARVRETVLPQIQVDGIDFRCRGGVITVIGTVPQPAVRERLITLVKQVPGVVNVTDQVAINAEIQGQTESGRVESGARLSGQSQTGQGQPVQVQPGQIQTGQVESNQAVDAAVEASRTNLAPTGRTNASPEAGVTNALPPGLEKREQLPPGLQNREELPPGLSERTNNATQPRP